MLGAYLIPVLLFADDLVLASRKHHVAQRLLDLLHTWCTTNALTVNTAKTKWMRVLGRKRKDMAGGERGGQCGDVEGLLYDGQPLEEVHMFPYLGLEFKGSATTRNMVAARVKASAKAWGRLVGTLTTLGWKDRATRLVLGDAFVRSTLLFGGPVWGANVVHADHDIVNNDAPLIDLVYRRILRQLMGLGPRVPRDLLYILSCRFPARVSLGKAMWRYWASLDRYPRAVADVATWAADVGEGPQAMARYRGKLTFGTLRAFHSRFSSEAELYRTFLAGLQRRFTGVPGPGRHERLLGRPL